MPKKTPDELLMTPSEAARVLDLTPAGVRAIEERGELRGMRTAGGRRLYRASEVEALRKAREKNPPRPGRKTT